jgi:hypothetical protein
MSLKLFASNWTYCKAGRCIAYSFCAADERDYLRSIEKLDTPGIETAEHHYQSEKRKMPEEMQQSQRKKTTWIRKTSATE